RLRRGREGLADWLAGESPPEALLGLLADAEDVPPNSAPDLIGSEYGTRASSMVLCQGAGDALFNERRHHPEQSVEGETRASSAPARSGSDHGTRDSSTVLCEGSGDDLYIEHRYHPEEGGEGKTRARWPHGARIPQLEEVR